MKTISTLVMAALCLFLTTHTNAQNQVSYKPVQIGQKIPEVDLTNIHNYKTSKLNLADFEARLIIIDFWATWCTACIASFPKMEQLQNQYKDQVQFLKVTNQKEAEALPFLEKLYKEKPSIIPGITDDKQLHQLFPHQYLPHYVWIDESGTLIATTSAEQVSSENIDKVLSHNKPSLQLKVDLKQGKSLFLKDDLLKGNQLKQYSLFFKGRYDGLSSGFSTQKTGDRQTGLSLTNLPLISLYDHVISALYRQQGELYTRSKRIIQVKDSSKLMYNKDLPSSEYYTYECNAPDLQGTSLYQYILEDLNRYTDYTGTIEKRKVKCLVLKKTGKADQLKTTGGVAQNTLFKRPDGKLINGPFRYLLIRLIDLPIIKLPLIDETGYTGKIDITLSQKPDLSLLQKELKAYGLELAEKERTINVFVLKDKFTGIQP